MFSSEQSYPGLGDMLDEICTSETGIKSDGRRDGHTDRSVESIIPRY